MQADIERVLIDRHQIARRVQDLAATITRDVAGSLAAEGATEITLIPILTGSIIFVSDLIRHLPLRLQIRLIGVSSYPGTATQSKGARLRADLTGLPTSLRGAHVLIIDDILDSGSTIRLVKGLVNELEPATVRTCVLLRKDRQQARDVEVDYVCFDIPDEFVVGYGLDYNDYYRNLPDIVTLRPRVIEEAQMQAQAHSRTGG
jgi:hypoxanthine phosphoribosyltransferase